MESPISGLGIGSTKEKVIELLSEKWPLTAKRIHRRLSRSYRLSVTYQAVYKTLKELLEKNVLKKERQGYFINKEWVEKLDSFNEKIKVELKSENVERKIKTIYKLSFKTHFDFIKFHVDFMEETIRKDKKVTMLFYYRHVPCPNVLSIQEINKLKPLLKSKLKWTIVSKGSSPLDKWNANYWKKLGIKVEMGKDVLTDSRLIVMNDFVINVFSSKKSIKVWDDIYSVKEVRRVNLHKLTEGILNKRYKTIATVMKDKELASLLREMATG